MVIHTTLDCENRRQYDHLTLNQKSSFDGTGNTIFKCTKKTLTPRQSRKEFLESKQAQACIQFRELHQLDQQLKTPWTNESSDPSEIAQEKLDNLTYSATK